MTFQPRDWQQRCFDRFVSVADSGKRTFVLEACPGAGKSAAAAMIAAYLRRHGLVDHILALVPWKSIQGDPEKGMLGAFGRDMGLECRSQFFTQSRRLPFQRIPRMDGTVTLYHEVCNQNAIECLEMWKSKRLGDGRPWRFALICDEIHHANEINGTWGAYISRMHGLADFSVFMSGTFFRTDGHQIACVPVGGDGRPQKDFSYTYKAALEDEVVRFIAVRRIDARVRLYDPNTETEYEKDLKDIADSSAELAAAKRQVLDPHGDCIRTMIEQVHQNLSEARHTFRDAACLFVCRPGDFDGYGNDGGDAEDRHVNAIAERVREITGETPVVVTHHDRDAIAKLAQFRKGTTPYLVAVNMISEGCDIPRLRAVAFCRYTRSEMLFRQIAGRAMRLNYGRDGRPDEDGTAAMIYIPTFSKMLEFGERLEDEADDVIRDRRCATCGLWPCTCPCPKCGQERPCQCQRDLTVRDLPLVAIDADAVLDGGNIGADSVSERSIQLFRRVKAEVPALRHFNDVQGGVVFERGMALDRADRAGGMTAAVTRNPTADRVRLADKANSLVRKLAKHRHEGDHAKAYYHEIEVPFKTKFSIIRQTWNVDQLQDIIDRLERRLKEAYQHG